MSRKNYSGDLEFHVEDAGGHTQIFETGDEAAGLAVSLCMGDGEPHYIDVVTWTRAAAVKYAGSDGGDIYDEDPEASVFERIEVKARSFGTVP
jgi:hypothetical protein